MAVIGFAERFSESAGESVMRWLAASPLPLGLRRWTRAGPELSYSHSSSAGGRVRARSCPVGDFVEHGSAVISGLEAFRLCRQPFRPCHQTLVVAEIFETNIFLRE